MIDSREPDKIRSQGPPAAFDVIVLLAAAMTRPVRLAGLNIKRGADVDGPIILLLGGATVGFIVAALLASRVGWSRALLISSGVVFAFYNWNPLTRLLTNVSVAWVPGFLVPMVLVGVFAIVVLRMSSLAGIRLVALAMSSGLFVSIPSIVDWVTSAPAEAVAVEIVDVADEPGPDVLVLVLDGYGRGDVMEEMYGFDNGPFLSFLTSSGFSIPRSARANYSMTVASLSSALSMSYTVPAGTAPSERGELAMHVAIGGENTFMRSLDRAGYDIVYLESGWVGSRCGAVVTTCFRSSVYDEMAGVILHSTPFGSLVESRLGSPFTHNGMRVFEHLAKILETPSSRPRFVFAHVIVPHGPFFLTPDCSVDSAGARSGGAVGDLTLSEAGRSERRAFYVEQVRCVNAMVREVVGALDDDTIAVIVGDHGPDSGGQATLEPALWSSADTWERMSILAAIRVPEECSQWIYPEITLVNTFRLVLRCLGGEVDFIDDFSYIYPHPPNARLADGSVARSVRLEGFER